MEAIGATTFPSNGGPPRIVERSDLYREQITELRPLVPRIDLIDSILERQLAHNAEEGGVRVAANAWVRETVEGYGAPQLLVIYSITDRHVCMEQIHLTYQDPDAPLPY